MCKKDEGIVMSNFAALRAAVFPLSTKKLRGGGTDIRPPSVRGLCTIFSGFGQQNFPTVAKNSYVSRVSCASHVWQLFAHIRRHDKITLRSPPTHSNTGHSQQSQASAHRSHWFIYKKGYAIAITFHGIATLNHHILSKRQAFTYRREHAFLLHMSRTFTLEAWDAIQLVPNSNKYNWDLSMLTTENISLCGQLSVWSMEYWFVVKYLWMFELLRSFGHRNSPNTMTHWRCA